MAPNTFFKKCDQSCKLIFCHAIPIMFTEEVSAVLIEFSKGRHKRHASRHQQTATQLRYQTWPIGRKYRQLTFKLVSNSISKRESEPMKSQESPFGMSGRILYFECIKENLFFVNSHLEVFSSLG
jgi:hypothetical protein